MTVPSGWRRWAGRLATMLISLVLALGVAEAVVRHVPPDFDALRDLLLTDPVTGYRLRPGATVRFAGLYSRLTRPVTWQVNEQGFRGTRPVGARGDRFRVATYGDSETFGWSVDLADTFQHQMERLDPAVEVINLGVPGYNVVDIANHMRRTLPELAPDLVVYLVHKNDFDDPVRISPVVAGSHLLARLRLLGHFTTGKEERLRRRHSAERAAVFAREVDGMTKLSADHGAPLLLAFLKWGSRRALGDRADAYWTLNVHAAVDDHPKQDQHMLPPALAQLATMLCEEISDGRGGCRPPGPPSGAGALDGTRPGEGAPSA